MYMCKPHSIPSLTSIHTCIHQAQQGAGGAAGNGDDDLHNIGGGLNARAKAIGFVDEKGHPPLNMVEMLNRVSCEVDLGT